MKGSWVCSSALCPVPSCSQAGNALDDGSGNIHSLAKDREWKRWSSAFASRVFSTGKVISEPQTLSQRNPAHGAVPSIRLLEEGRQPHVSLSRDQGCCHDKATPAQSLLREKANSSPPTAKPSTGSPRSVTKNKSHSFGIPPSQLAIRHLGPVRNLLYRTKGQTTRKVSLTSRPNFLHKTPNLLRKNSLFPGGLLLQF